MYSTVGPGAGYSAGAGKAQLAAAGTECTENATAEAAHCAGAASLSGGCCCTSGIPTQSIPSPVVVIVGCLSRMNFLCSSPRGSSALHGDCMGVPRLHCGC